MEKNGYNYEGIIKPDIIKTMNKENIAFIVGFYKGYNACKNDIKNIKK